MLSRLTMLLTFVNSNTLYGGSPQGPSQVCIHPGGTGTVRIHMQYRYSPAIDRSAVQRSCDTFAVTRPETSTLLAELLGCWLIAWWLTSIPLPPVITAEHFLEGTQCPKCGRGGGKLQVLSLSPNLAIPIPVLFPEEQCWALLGVLPPPSAKRKLGSASLKHLDSAFCSVPSSQSSPAGVGLWYDARLRYGRYFSFQGLFD